MIALLELKGQCMCPWAFLGGSLGIGLLQLLQLVCVCLFLFCGFRGFAILGWRCKEKREKEDMQQEELNTSTTNE